MTDASHPLPTLIRTAVVNQRIYPPGNPMVERSIAQIFQAIDALFQTSSEHVTLTNRQGKIFFRGKEIAEDPLVQIFEEHEIQSLTFLQGLTPAEVSHLVLLLGKKKVSGENLADWLQAQKVTHVQLDKIKVMEVMEGEVVIKKLDVLFDRVQDFPSLVGSLRESYDMIDQIADERGRKESQEHLARKLAALPAPLIRDMFENELPKRVEESGLRPAVLNAMTQEKLRDIFSEIGNWYRQIRAQSASDFEVVDHLNKFKSFLGKLLSAPASQKVPFAIYEELLQQGLLDEIPSHIQKQPEEESVASQVDHLLEKPASDLLEQPMRDQIPFLFKKLCGIGLDDVCQKLLDKFMENFNNGTPLIRQMAVKSSDSFLEIFWVNRKESFWGKLNRSIEQLADVERSTDVYKEVANALSDTVQHFLLNEHFPGALQALAILRRHHHEESPFIEKRTEIAGQALQKIADNVMDVITEDLLSQDKTKKDTAQTVLAYLGERAVPCFVGMIKKAEDVRHRRLAAAALKYHGEPAKAKLAAEFHVGNSTSVLLNILSVLDDLLSPELVLRFESFLHFPDAAVRRRIIQLVGRIPGEGAAGLMVRFLDDPDESAQIEAIRAVGEFKNHGAVFKLMDLTKGASTLRLEEVCLALGKIGDDAAVPALSDLLETKGGLFKKKTGVEETVRVRAAWALAQIPTSQARNALSRCLKDDNLQIQTIARQAIDSRVM